MIPDLETSDVQLKGSPAKVHRDPFHQHLVLRKDRVATVAPFAVASTTPNLFDAVVRQTPVPDLALDEKAEGFLVHGGLPGSQPATCLVANRSPNQVRAFGQTLYFVGKADFNTNEEVIGRPCTSPGALPRPNPTTGVRS